MGFVDSNKIEDMLSQLIRMVGSMQTEQQSMKSDMLEMKQEMLSMKQDMFEMKQDIANLKQDIIRIDEKADKRHVEILKELRSLKIDQDFTWEKAVRNERDIEQLKGKIS